MAVPAVAAPHPPRLLVPIGSDYQPATLQRFARAAAAHDTSGSVDIVVLPITFATDPYSITVEERVENRDLADQRRGQVQDACEAVRRADQLCRAVLVDIEVRDDAFKPENLALFTSDLDGIYILGGDQTIAMKVVADTPTERLMSRAYKAGAVVGGNSAGAAVESRTMIAGYIGDNGPENGLQRGSVDLWSGSSRSDTERGLLFGLRPALLDQHVLQRGRIGRLLNVTFQTGLLGIGVDAETAATIANESRLLDVTGRSAAIVIDTKTYHADGRYAGPTDSLTIRHVTTHLIPPGGGGYDLATRRPLIHNRPQNPPSIAGRRFDGLKLPKGYGPLLLGGDLSGDRAGLVIDRFVALSGGPQRARLVVLTAGYADAGAAQADAQAYAAALDGKIDATTATFALGAGADDAAAIAAIGQATGVLLTAPDQSTVLAALDAHKPVIATLRKAWRHGTALLADNAAAAALGRRVVRTPPRSDDYEEESIISFRPDSVMIDAGLAFVGELSIEPALLPERRWGELYNLSYRDPKRLAIGVDVGTALELRQAGAVVRGTSAIVVLDGRSARFAVGDNGALGARYVMLDSFIDGGRVTP
jgi:cyanophycinase